MPAPSQGHLLPSAATQTGYWGRRAGEGGGAWQRCNRACVFASMFEANLKACLGFGVQNKLGGNRRKIGGSLNLVRH